MFLKLDTVFYFFNNIKNSAKMTILQEQRWTETSSINKAASGQYSSSEDVEAYNFLYETFNTDYDYSDDDQVDIHDNSDDINDNKSLISENVDKAAKARYCF